MLPLEDRAKDYEFKNTSKQTIKFLHENDIKGPLLDRVAKQVVETFAIFKIPRRSFASINIRLSNGISVAFGPLAACADLRLYGLVHLSPGCTSRARINGGGLLVLCFLNRNFLSMSI